MLLRVLNRTWNEDGTWNPEVNWHILLMKGVPEVCDAAAKKVAFRHEYGPGFELEDLQQTAREIVSGVNVSKPHEGPTRNPWRVQELARPGTFGLLRHELECDLINVMKRHADSASKTTSYTARYEAQDAAEDGEAPRAYPTLPPTTEVPGKGYTAASVKTLLPAVWDPGFAWGMQAENPPDRDMPRAKPNPATGGNLAAHLADIKRAWERADLDAEHRRALLLVFGLDWLQREVAYNQGVDQSAISRRVQRGVELLLAALGKQPVRESSPAAA